MTIWSVKTVYSEAFNILFTFRIKEEIEGMKTEGKEENREEKNNTDKYLALTLPARHNEGMLMNEPKQRYPIKRHSPISVFKRTCTNV